MLKFGMISKKSVNATGTCGRAPIVKALRRGANILKGSLLMRSILTVLETLILIVALILNLTWWLIKNFIITILVLTLMAVYRNEK